MRSYLTLTPPLFARRSETLQLVRLFHARRRDPLRRSASARPGPARAADQGGGDQPGRHADLPRRLQARLPAARCTFPVPNLFWRVFLFLLRSLSSVCFWRVQGGGIGLERVVVSSLSSLSLPLNLTLADSYGSSTDAFSPDQQHPSRFAVPA